MRVNESAEYNCVPQGTDSPYRNVIRIDKMLVMASAPVRYTFPGGTGARPVFGYKQQQVNWKKLSDEDCVALRC